VILLAAYAVFVWYLAVRYRREWRGFASVALGVVVLLAISRPAIGEHALGALLPSGLRTGYRHLLILLIPEAGLVGLIGFFIASLPRRESATACKGCGYELSGLDPRGLRCPECGREWRGAGSGREPPPIVLTPIARGPVRRRVNV
jgi:hypothetical protein